MLLRWNPCATFLISVLFVLITAASVVSVDDDTSENNSVLPPTKRPATASRDRDLVCPDPKGRSLPLFTLPCKTDAECRILGEQCCNEDGKFRCRAGVPKQKPELKHRPLLGVLPRECPKEPFTESFAVRNCTKDEDCWPRICCQDGFHSYCRTAAPQWERVPRLSPLKRMVAYLQCTPAPPPLFDLFPKPCRTTIDCFPNLCCQEEHKKVCRPPKKSLLALIASVTQV